MFDTKYLSPDHLKGLSNYKYQAIDTSPLSVYVMHPFWNKVVEFIPRWVAPNLLTFVGFLLTVLNFVVLSYYDYDYTASVSPDLNVTSPSGHLAGGHLDNGGHFGPIPPRAWYFLATFLFLAYTLDGVDGKQARRTGTSGPLGEMFDHGLDSWSVSFIPACLYSVFGRGDFSAPPLRMYYLIWNVMLNFYVSHWEKYNTGVLYLPWGYDVSMWASTMVFLWTGARGPGFYKQHVGWLTLADAFELGIYGAGLAANLPVSVYNVYLSYKHKTGKQLPLAEAVRPLWSVLGVFLACTVWVHRSPGRLLDSQPRLVFLLVGALFSNVACRLIVAQMSSQRCELVTRQTWAVAAACAVSLRWPRLEPAVFYLTVGFAINAHVHYGTCVVRQLCDHFKINCFVVKKRSA